MKSKNQSGVSWDNATEHTKQADVYELGIVALPQINKQNLGR